MDELSRHGDPTSDSVPADDVPRASARVERLVGVFAGLLAAAAGLGTAELTSGLRRSWRSPVLDVGDRIIDRVPRAVKELAIEWFGTNDKKALLIGVALVLALYAASLGVIAFRRSLLAGLIGVAAFGAVGCWAALGARTAPPTDAVAPSVVGALVAALTLALVTRAWFLAGSGPMTAQPPVMAGGEPTGEPAVEPAGEDAGENRGGVPTSSRRRFLVTVGTAATLAAATTALGRRLGARFDAAASRASVVLPRARRRLPPVPAAVQVPVDGVSPFVTPNADFYRIDINLSVPDIDADRWRLNVHGMVERPLELSFSDVLARDLVESDITLTCVSNEVGGGLLGNARWLGIRLDDLLREAGVRPDADQVIGRSVDGYTCGFPVAALDGRDALIAVGMNGEPLPLEHGFPARLIVPGLYGYVSATKWLTEIELGRFDDHQQYWVERGWDEQAPIKMSSRIDTPRGLSTVPAGTVAIAGVAWSQPIGISGVQVRIDDGQWIDATLAEELNGSTWRQWSLAWTATAGRHDVAVRAIDANGAIQTEERSEPFPNGSTGCHQIVVIVA